MKANKHPLAVLTAQLTSPDGWQQLLPKGEFRARDGRPTDVPHWYLDAEIAKRLIHRAENLRQDILVDYDHATLLKAKQGIDEGNVVAAGWFNDVEMQWFDDDQRQGLYIKPRWTPKAYQQIKDGEFAFLSAVFPYDDNGEPIEIRMAALTNDPGITGMQRLAVLSAITDQQETAQMGKLRTLLSKLGIEIAEGTEITDEQAEAALQALDTLQTEKATAENQVVALSAKEVDLTAYVPKSTYDAVVAKVAVLSAKNDEVEIDNTITKARNEGRVIEAEVEYLKGFGKQQGVAALSAMLAQRPQLAVLSAQQTETTKVEKQVKGEAVLSAADKEAARLLGINEADFAKELEAK
ncbi:phage protease [Mannheimia haemolytica]|uniref:phage protease n=1 Tax=Mannheimia haemolytica TaxID=75985 RepID=UPI0001BCF7E7|nr:phage protease [Mannheimia haemolytica]EEY13315.1 I protein [Mannheimia haemolytica serotype A2 str. BOVINE]MDW0736615.1 phage protease [Mannheimia haemolytica]TRC15197.1 hypothetical protein FEA50_04545 [Mannheimia haemolytica]TRC67704.1 hypothetical protein FEA31_04700 [Mannheimia haemolytica]HDL3365502.1 hypothetical protein [Mannheimia haemolytica]